MRASRFCVRCGSGCPADCSLACPRWVQGPRTAQGVDSRAVDASLIAVLAGLAVAVGTVALAAALQSRSDADGFRPSSWGSAAAELGLMVSSGNSGSLTSYPLHTALELSGSIHDCGVRVQRLETDPGQRDWRVETRITVTAARQGTREPSPHADARSAFAALRARHVTLSNGALCYEESGKLDDAEVVRVVRDMLAICGVEGRQALEELAAQGFSEARPEALGFLTSLHPYSACTAAISAALAGGDEEMKRIAVTAIARAKDAAFLDRVVGLAEGSGDPLAEAVAHALGEIGGPREEPVLLGLLTRHATPVRRAAAVALGNVGTIGAVEPLLPFTKWILTPDLETAAQEAIARIQARLGNPEAGRISLTAEGPAGELSLSGDEGGLSLARGGRAKE